MKRFSLFLIAASMLLLTTLPAWAKVTVKNKTDFKLDVVIKDTRQRQNQTLPPGEKLTFQTPESGGQMIILKKGDEVVKKYFDDGDKYIIIVDGENIVLKKDNTI
jgi:hypothetical protein